MERVKVRLKGIAPLMMHNVRLANSFDRYSIATKEISDANKKKNKTVANTQLLARIEWEGGLYMDGGKVGLPAKCLDACFWGGAKKSNNGKQWLPGVSLSESFYPLEINGNNNGWEESGNIPNSKLDKLFLKYHDSRIERVQKSAILRTRPIFYEWAVECAVDIDEGIINKEKVKKAIVDAGYLLGLLEKRPRYGRFEVEFLS